MKQAFPVAAAIFASLVVAVVMIANVQKPKKPAKAKPAAAVNQPLDPAFKAGFTIGFTMAKTGAKRPSAAEVDAMARKQEFQAGAKASPGYKLQWKNGFMMGWSQGD